MFSGWGKGIGYPTKAIMFGIGFIKMKRAALKYNVNFLNPNILSKSVEVNFFLRSETIF